MKVIGLLNKIANGEEVPEKIRLEDNPDIFYYQKDINSYKSKKEYLISEWLFNSKRLNYEVKIIEEDNKIEKLVFNKDQDGDVSVNGVSLIEKVNEIIDIINKEK